MIKRLWNGGKSWEFSVDSSVWAINEIDWKSNASSRFYIEMMQIKALKAAFVVYRVHNISNNGFFDQSCKLILAEVATMIWISFFEEFVVAVVREFSTKDLADVVHELLKLFPVDAAVVVFVISDPQLVDYFIMFYVLLFHFLK